MRPIALTFFVLIGSFVMAQALLIEPGMEDPMLLRFNPAFIQRNHITAIQGQPMVKRENEPMRDKSGGHLYRFDDQGRMIYSNNSFGKPGSGRDTAAIIYTYDAAGRPISELHNDLNGHFVLDRELDDSGQIVREVYARVENLGTDRYHLIPGERIEISDERFSHRTLNDTASMTTFQNNLGLPYREQIRSRDRWGYQRSIDDRYLVSGRRGSTTFRYDEKGRLAERIDHPDRSQPSTTKHEWRYDAMGNVTTCDAWRDDRQILHEEFIYEEGTLFLKARISRDLETGLIHIVRYTTERK